MTVTDIRERRAETESAVTGLVAKIEAAIENSLAIISLETARAMANESGLHRYQDMLLDSLDQLEVARRAKREAALELDDAKSEYDSAVTEATWSLEGHFTVRSNKQWLAKAIDGTAIAEDDQKSYDAAARKEWCEHHAARVPAVVQAKKQLDAVTERVAQANDDIAMAERGAKAAEHLLDAAREELVLLATALRVPAATAHIQNGAGK